MGKRTGKQEPQGTKQSSAHVQVLGLGLDTGDGLPSVLLFFDRQRYLFNAGEGFQRYCVEHKIKLARMSGVLATRISTEAIGGLPGMFITMADTACGALLAHSEEMTLYGPQGVKIFMNALRTFMNLRDVPIKVTEFPSSSPVSEQAASLPQPTIQNDLVSIHPVVLSAHQADGQAGHAEAPAAKRQRTGEPPAGINGQESSKELGQRWKPADLAEGQVVTGATGSQAAVCYVCQLPRVRGKFLPQKAASLGVQRGPLFGKLQKGESVQSANGRTVHPHEVQEAEEPGPCVVIADCPTPGHILQLQQSLPASLFSSAADPEPSASAASGPVNCIVHLSPAHVVSEPAYREWMDSFGSQTTHLMANSSAAGGDPILASSTRIHARLNVLGPQYFSIPSTAHMPAAAESAAAAEENGGPARPEAVGAAAAADQEAGVGAPKAVMAAANGKPAESIHPGRNLLKYILVPVGRQGIDAGEVLKPLDIAEAQAELATEQPDTIAMASQALQAATVSSPAASSVPEIVSRADRELLEVCFLGTGAAIPSKYRNVTSLYLRLFKNGGLLLDCGEGTLSQLIRLLGPAGADAALRSLHCIWISHIHADHHAGLSRVLSRRAQLLGQAAPPLLVLGPRPLKRVLAAYAELEPLAFRWADCVNTVPNSTEASSEQAVADSISAVKSALGLKRLESVPVVHCRNAYGIVLESAAGWKFAFSGDTRPCPQMAAAAKDATILVHEATFEDELKDQAIAKRHSLTCEAVDIGRQAGAYRVILTHFSQRYPKIPVLGDSRAESTCIAFDLMTVNLADLPRLPLLVPALELLFKDSEEVGAQEPVPEMLS